MTLRLPSTIGTRVKFYRQIQGMTVADLIHASQVSRSAIIMVESDKTHVTVCILHKLAQALGVSCAHLLGEVALLDHSFFTTEDPSYAKHA